MDTFSISFTLGKASDPHGADLAHNDRQFIAPNVDLQRTYQNVTYVKEDIEDAYETLFGEALAEYNARQKQKCRRIENYYEHIRDGDREEAFYEIIIQFGDSKTAPCGSERGEMAKHVIPGEAPGRCGSDTDAVAGSGGAFAANGEDRV